MRLERRYRVRHGQHLPLAAFVMHPQMRLTVNEEGIEQLAENIFHHGLIHPICVADTSEGYVVVSGHRRLRAYKILKGRGHSVGKIPVIIFENLTSIEMALLQASENIHEQVPPQEAAKFYEATWRLLKAHEPSFTLSDFARAVGRSEQTIRNALRFMLLPQSIQRFVARGALPYGSALQLTRLYEVVTEETLRYWAIRFISSGAKVPDARMQVEQYLSDLRSGQLSLLDIFHESVRKEIERNSRRMRIDAATTRAFWDAMRYLHTLLTLFEEGKLCSEDFPWLRRRPKEAFFTLLSLQRRILNFMESVLLDTEVEDARQLFEEYENVIGRQETVS